MGFTAYGGAKALFGQSKSDNLSIEAFKIFDINMNTLCEPLPTYTKQNRVSSVFITDPRKLAFAKAAKVSSGINKRLWKSAEKVDYIPKRRKREVINLAIFNGLMPFVILSLY